MNDIGAWRAAAGELASWTITRLVNRVDVWGHYYPWIDRDGVEHTTRTAPSVDRRGKLQLNQMLLESHYRGDLHRRIGLHSTSAENTSRWLAFDVDLHDESTTITAAGNFALVERLVEWCVVRGYRVVVEDSNGAGGFHVWMLFDAPAQTADVFALGETIVRALRATIETFPKQAAIQSGRYGNWLRLPGLHHKRPHWSRILGPHGHWLDGEAAVDALLNATINPAAMIPPAPVRASHETSYRAPARELSGDVLERRITRYLNQLPSLGAGQNRNGVGFRFACFLVRDCGLSDPDALSWLTRWNTANVTPYPESKVEALVADAHTYGGHAIRAGLSA